MTGTPKSMAGNRTLRTSTLLALALLLLLVLPARAAVEAVEGGIRFTYPDARAQAVFLAGSFNNWSATGTAMTADGGVWSAVVELGPGDYEYKFVVDGQWVADPENPTTVGEFGNSALSVAADGSITQLAATSNTTLSPKILLQGRAIALYEYREDRGEDRYELERPGLDFDLDFNVRVNSNLTAHVLTNVNNEAENVDFYQTRLNFDRGSLTYEDPSIFLQAWDNEGIATWDDPLHLVGNIGIYDHLFGYGTTGARARKSFAGFEAEAFYTDDGEPGSGFPAAPSEEDLSVEIEDALVWTGDRYAFGRSPILYTYVDASGNEDVLAARISRDTSKWLGRPSLARLLYRLDRGAHPGAGAALLVDPSDRTRGTVVGFDEATEQWQGLGGHASVEVAPALRVEAQFLHGRAWVEPRDGTLEDVSFATEIDAGGGTPETTIVVTRSGTRPIGDRELDLDESNRFFLGLRASQAPLDLRGGLSLEYEDHAQELFATLLDGTLENSATTVRLDLAREWSRIRGSLDLAYTAFDYDDRTPWANQLWFDARNFWLEQGEHEVAYERLTLLGGRDAVVWKPRITARVHDGREVDVTYAGTLAAEGIDSKPKYAESLLQVDGRLSRNWSASWDSRLVRYDAPALELSDSFFSTFFEVAFRPVEGVDLAVSWGVDPYVIDEPVNEYGYIGRDLFLFGEGANAGQARSDYRGLGEKILAAEEALEDERRIQFEARLVF